MPGRAPRPRIREHLVEVIDVIDLTPWYRRIELAANGLFDSWTPAPGAYLILNLTSQNGTPAQRSYSIRHATPNIFCCEFVMHDGGGPGCQWARQARPGTLLSVSEPPYNLSIPDTSQALLIADPTALPAAASLAVALNPRTHLTMLVEDAHQDHDRIPLQMPVTWVESVDEDLLDEATAGLDPQDCFLWAAGERRLAKMVREYARQRFVVPRPSQHIQTYWIAQPGH